MIRVNLATRQKAQQLLRAVTVKAAVEYLNAREGADPVSYEQIDAIRRGMVKRGETIAKPSSKPSGRNSQTVSRHDEAIGSDCYDRSRRSQATAGCIEMATRIDALIRRRALEINASPAAMRSVLLGAPFEAALA